MPARRVYLDHNATTPLLPAARAAMIDAYDLLGNASSIHSEGRAARAAIEKARAELARLVGAAIGDVVFTSGGTESLNLALSPSLHVGAGPQPAFDRLLIAAGEHAAVRSGHRFGGAADLVALTADGVLDLAALEAALRKHAGQRVMLALQAANNETGVIQPVAAAAALVHAAGGAVVCDAVQALGKSPCDFTTLGVDVLAFSAHKIGGPKGVGALCFAPGGHHVAEPLVGGGGQEQGRRAGTENVAGIVGFGAAVRAAMLGHSIDGDRLGHFRDRLESLVEQRVPEVIFFGRGAPRLPNTSAFTIPRIGAQVLLMGLDLADIAVSSGSACSSGRVGRSHVLDAMGVAPEVAQGAIRVSFGWDSSAEDGELFARALAKVVEAVKARRLQSAA